MDKEWLQLTEEDINRARQQVSERPATPDVLVIDTSDITEESAMVSTPAGVLKITSEDLAPATPRHSAPADLRELEIQMYELVNSARREHLPRWLGTSHLKWYEPLAALSRGHSDDMLRRQYIAHDTPEGITTAQRINQQGVSYVACGENIGVVYGNAAGTPLSVQDIHNAFMNQPRSLTNHRGNLLNPIWTHVGIGIAHNPDGSLVATQTFISAPANRFRGR